MVRLEMGIKELGLQPIVICKPLIDYKMGNLVLTKGMFMEKKWEAGKQVKKQLLIE